MNPVAREYPARPLVGVGVVLLRPAPDGWQVLLVQRGRPPAQGSWSLPGGAQRVGETAAAAARRELAEETGLGAGPLVLADISDLIQLDALGRVQFHYTILNYGGVVSEGALRAGGDALEAVWAPVGALAGFALGQALRPVLERARALLFDETAAGLMAPRSALIAGEESGPSTSFDVEAFIARKRGSQAP